MLDKIAARLKRFETEGVVGLSVIPAIEAEKAPGIVYVYDHQTAHRYDGEALLPLLLKATLVGFWASLSAAERPI